MDVFQRKCKPLDLSSATESGSFETETETKTETEYQEEEIQEEIEEEYIKSEESIDTATIYKELECMKQRIQFLQVFLQKDINKCPEEECIDPEIILSCSKNPEICALQKNHHKLQSQIKELIMCHRLAKEQIRYLRVLLCDKTQDVLELQKLVASLITWRNDIDHEFGKCIERFEYLKHVKAEWEDVEEKLDCQRKCLKYVTETFVPNILYTQDKKSFIETINEMRSMLKEMVEFQINRFSVFQTFMNDTKEAMNTNNNSTNADQNSHYSKWNDVKKEK